MIIVLLISIIYIHCVLGSGPCILPIMFAFQKGGMELKFLYNVCCAGENIKIFSVVTHRWFTSKQTLSLSFYLRLVVSQRHLDIMADNHYETLNLTKDADQEQIKKAYRELADEVGIVVRFCMRNIVLHLFHHLWHTFLFHNAAQQYPGARSYCRT